MASVSIDVILPTFNGVRFLREQVASIAQQTMRPRMLLVRDDGSTDGTQELIRELIEIYGAWIKVLPGDENLGCTGNVNQLLEATSAPYVALADQDDVWLPNKLEIAYQELCAVESVHGPHAPALVHTDLKLVDANLNDLGTTYVQKQLLHPSWVSPSEIALTNIVTGCTVMCNRSLLECALPFPQEALVHDWWLALVASVFGSIRFHPSSEILYRQHAANSIGASGLGWHYWWKRLRQFFNDPANGGHTRQVIRQMDGFEKRYHIVVSPLPLLIRLGRLQRVVWLLRHPVSEWPRKHGLLRTIAFYLQILCF